MCERYIHRLPLARPPTGDLACNPGMCPYWELNQQPFGLQAGTQSTEPHRPGLKTLLKDFSVEGNSNVPLALLLV